MSSERPTRAEARAAVTRPEGIPDDAIVSVITVRADHAGHRLDRWLTLELTRLTRTRAQRIVESFAFTTDARQLRPSHRVREGEVIVLYRLRWEEPDVPRNVTVLYEDAAMIAVDKPAGLPVHPSARYHQNTLTAVLSERFRGERVVLAHRLDRETSGLILAARTFESERSLKAAFADRRVHKTYLALVRGAPADDGFTVDAPMAADPSGVSVKMRVCPESQGGIAALTRVEVLERFEGFALVAAHPETGRQHQIRVHLAHAGFPIVGDKLYAHGDEMFVRCIDAPPDEATMAELLLPRHALHAHAVTFEHPTTGAPTRLVAPIADDMRMFCDVRRSGPGVASALDAAPER